MLQSTSPKVVPSPAKPPMFPAPFTAWAWPEPPREERLDEATVSTLFDDDIPVTWTEEDIVFLHWRLLKDTDQLADPTAPLDKKFDILRWVFTEPEKDAKPFSFASCLRVVGCSPLSPIAYCGLVDVENVRDYIRNSLRVWFRPTLARYPDWVRDALIHTPQWIESRLAKNPQWINEQIKHMSVTGDLFN